MRKARALNSRFICIISVISLSRWHGVIINAQLGDVMWVLEVSNRFQAVLRMEAEARNPSSPITTYKGNNI